jgi:tetratricopeptide (TPR) repeat protein
MQEITKANVGFSGPRGICVARCALTIAVVLAPFLTAQNPAKCSIATQATVQGDVTKGTIQGYVRDSNGKPLSDVTLFLRPAILRPAIGADGAAEEPLAAHTDSTGAFRFSPLPQGLYNLAAEKEGYRKTVIDALVVKPNAPKTIALILQSVTNSEVANSPSVATQRFVNPTPEFFDEPHFTVAGVTQAAGAGGHGSDTVVRTTDSLARVTRSLEQTTGKETMGDDSASASRPALVADEAALRSSLERQPDNFEANRRLGMLLASGGNPAEARPYLERATHLDPGSAEAHHLLGNVSEKLNRPLDAVREYQRAAELDPSERNLFDWGAELLAHRAFEPATDVFTTGNKLFPKSGRMLVAQGVAWYARGSYERSTQSLTRASDLNPNDPNPYLFLGQMQMAQMTASAGSVEQFARFAELQPDNALANYYYAVSLRKQSPGAIEPAVATRIESLLLKAVRLNPGLGDAHLQLGILYSQRGDITRSISEYREAVAVGSNSDDTLAEAHYRLGQAYVKAGQKAKAREEFERHHQLANKIQEDTTRERRDVQQFVISLRGDRADSYGKR